MSARSEILARVRAALADNPAVHRVPREYRQHSRDAGTAELVEMFGERLAEYTARVHRAAPEHSPAGITAEVLRARGARSAVVARGLPARWRPTTASITLVDDAGLDIDELDHTDAAVTGCAVAIAETGTLVLDAGADQGRRAISLIPDHHVCVVRTDQIVGTVAEALAALDPLRPLTFVSGPSATSDIELDRVEGVHGPRHLDVIVTPVEC
ncbi:L-lactate dehydrogenase complex protein LldG [Haloechinothrix alba]|uniref:L-lactate dehydrogenase complex protein LldG n=1 Tax=Haloechinothrix alba TaxID=664784 RepID=A0A238WSP8_9PSEU|nr:lactate utilization protein C [Haloechinothrix alba]SNR49264.1 L-lactate dehydrogenase complex protein LldG [Haloechinothrix alba]